MDIKTHLGVYAFVIKDNKLLLIRKARGPYTGLYDLPGGTIEPEELIVETLKREIKEETMCDLIRCEQILTLDHKCIWDRTSENKGKVLFKHIGILYLATVSGHPSTQGDGLDSGGAEWIEIQDIVHDKTKVTPFVKKGLNYISNGIK